MCEKEISIAIEKKNFHYHEPNTSVYQSYNNYWFLFIHIVSEYCLFEIRYEDFTDVLINYKFV